MAPIDVVLVDVVGHGELGKSPERAEAVLPVDFLPLLIGPSGVADWDLKQAGVPFGQLDRQLDLDAEIVRLEWNGLEQLGANRLVTRFHIGEIDVVDHVAEECEEFITELMPVE